MNGPLSKEDLQVLEAHLDFYVQFSRSGDTGEGEEAIKTLEQILNKITGYLSKKS